MKTVSQTFTEIKTTVTAQDAHTLVKAANRENEDAGGCCSGPGTSGTDHLRDIYLRAENGAKLRDPTVRSILSSFLKLNSQGVNQITVEKK